MENHYFFAKAEEITKGTILHLGTISSTPVVGLVKAANLTPDFSTYKLDKIRETMAVVDESWKIPIKGVKMTALKKRYKEKLEQAKELRKKLGDPIALGRTIIEIPEDKANEVLSEHKGYKYVSKKS
jgi:hypothetical protein